MYSMVPPQPAPPVPPAQPSSGKRMTVPQILLILFALGFLVWFLLHTFMGRAEEAQFGVISSGTAGNRYTGDCLIVRDETPYDAEGVTSVDYVAEEGSTIYRRDVICNVYSSGFSTREMKSLQDYRNQIKEYQIKLLNAEVATDPQMEKLEAEVMTRAREVREIIAGARGNMNNQERLLSSAIDMRQDYLKRKYSEDQRMTRLYDDELSQLQRISSWTKQYTASSEGIVSFYSDGYEYGLTVNNYDQFNPAQVRNMINGVKPEPPTSLKGKTTIYRVVKDGSWYAMMLLRDSKWNPMEGAVYELKLESFMDTTVKAEVVSFARTGNELLVRLRVESKVAPVLYIRTCSGELGDSISSLTVPARAIYEQDHMKGVVVVDGQYQTFIPVNILDQQGDVVFISPIQQGVLFSGQKIRLF